DRGHGLQVFGRPAVPLSEERTVLHRQLPAHDLRRARRGIRSRARSGTGDGPHLHPPCRSRTERLHLDRAPCRIVGRQPVRVHGGGHRSPVGAGAWRRERSRAEHAQGNRHARQDPALHRARQGQERSVPPDGLRPPRVQELRSARDRDAADGARGVLGAEGERSAVRNRASPRRDRAQRSLLHREEAVPERGLLFGHHPVGDRLPDHDV
ncbi:hypothetical protein OY671_009453, partial [Metschnikowia pulcherrima]